MTEVGGDAGAVEVGENVADSDDDHADSDADSFWEVVCDYF